MAPGCVEVQFTSLKSFEPVRKKNIILNRNNSKFTIRYVHNVVRANLGQNLDRSVQVTPTGLGGSGGSGNSGLGGVGNIAASASNAIVAASPSIASVSSSASISSLASTSSASSVQTAATSVGSETTLSSFGSSSRVTTELLAEPLSRDKFDDGGLPNQLAVMELTEEGVRFQSILYF